MVKLYLAEQYVRIVERGGGEEADFAHFARLLAVFENEMLSQLPDVPRKQEILESFLRSKTAIAADVSAQRAQTGEGKMREAAKERREELEMELRAEKEQNAKTQLELKERVAILEIEVARAGGADSSLREELVAAIAEKEQLAGRLEEAESRSEESAARLKRELESSVAQGADSLEALHKAMRSGEAEMEKEKALLEQKLEFLEKQQAETAAKEKQAREELIQSKREQSSS